MGVIAGDTAGNVYASYPLAEDGNYKYWVRRLRARSALARSLSAAARPCAGHASRVGFPTPRRVLSPLKDLALCRLPSLLPCVQVYTDPYDATVTKEDGTEETVPVTESANVVLVRAPWSRLAG